MKLKSLLLPMGAAAIVGVVLAQGPLTPPPGVPEPTMKTLEQIEPRTPISSLPFTIWQSGSYYLTRNLQFTATSGNAITINDNNVVLDLMGFTLSSGDTVTGDAIRLPDGFRHITIKNGVIEGATGVVVNGTAPNQTWTVNPAGFTYGIRADAPPFEVSSCHFTQLHISRCRINGLKAGDHAVVEQVTASMNGDTGIVLAAGGSVTNCTASYNGDSGITANTGTVTKCTANTNGGSFGILGGTVANCIAFGNGFSGISTSGSITSCVARSNGNSGFSVSGSFAAIANSEAFKNGGTGITCPFGSITNCVSHDNDGNGISANSATITNSSAIGNDGNGITSNSGSVTNCNASNNGDHGISVVSGVIAFCKANGNDSNNNGSVNIDAAGSTRTGNNPTP